MKRTLFLSLLALSSISMAAAPKWTMTQDTPGYDTYTTTQTGTFTFDSLGAAGIADGESFILTMKFESTVNPFVQGNAISFVAAKNGSAADLYDIKGADNQFRLYVRSSDKAYMFNINGNWSYGSEQAQTKIENYDWQVPNVDDISEENPVLIGLTFTFVNSADAVDGNDYFTLAPTADSQIQFDVHTEKNVVRSYNFNDLTNATGYAAAPDELKTTIIIQKETSNPSELYWKNHTGGEWHSQSWAGSATGAAKFTYADGKPVHFVDIGATNIVAVQVTEEMSPTDITVTGGQYSFYCIHSPLSADSTLTVSGGDAMFVGDISVGNLNMTAGKLMFTQLNVAKSAAITGGELCVSLPTKLTGKGNADGKTSSLSLGNCTLSTDDAGVTNETTHIELVNATLTGTITTKLGIALSGTTYVIADESNLRSSYSEADGNGYAIYEYDMAVITGGGKVAQTGDWKLNGDTAIAKSWNAEHTTVTLTTDTEVNNSYSVNNGAVVMDAAKQDSLKEGSSLVLSGGDLKLASSLRSDFSIEASESADIELSSSGVALSQNALSVDEGAEVTLSGEGVYKLENRATMKQGVTLSDESWTGTVDTGNVAAAGQALDISSLSNANSTVALGAVQADSLTSSSAAGIVASGPVVLENGASSIASDFSAAKGVTLGSADAAAQLTVANKLGLGDEGNLTLGHADSKVKASSLDGDKLNVQVSHRVLNGLGSQKGSVVLMTLNEEFTGPTTLNGVECEERVAEWGAKYYSSLKWQEAAAPEMRMLRFAARSSATYELVYTGTANANWLKEALSGQESNSKAGAAMLDDAFINLNPQTDAPDGDMAKVFDAMDNLLAAGDTKGAADVAAAAAGSATAVLGMASLGDVDRQLRAIRNRTTTMGVDQAMEHDKMPYFNAWINAEADRSEMADDGALGGYTLSSWGGTVGVDVDLAPSFTAGLALTAMSGDLDVTGAAKGSGDMDTCYVSAFARYCASAWTHTFVGTIGKGDISLERTIAGVTSKGDTESTSFGLMYEVGRVFALDYEGTTCLQPVFNVTWRHTSVDGYAEKGSDAAIAVDDQTLDAVTLGLGARLQTVVGENVYNRTSILECRMLVKAELGDREGSADVALAGLPSAKGSVDSAEKGAVGLEVGVGITLPLGSSDGVLFTDAAAEIRSDYTNVNATLGYRLNF